MKQVFKKCRTGSRSCIGLLPFVLSAVASSSCATTFTASPARVPASLWTDCRGFFENILILKGPDLYLQDPATERARAAIRSLDAEFRGVALSEDQAFLLIGDRLRPEEIERLLQGLGAESGRFLEPREVALRIEEITGRPAGLYGVMERLQQIYARERGAGSFDRLRAKLEEASGRTAAEKSAVRAEIEKRRRMVRLEGLLEAPALFGVQVLDREVRFPNGSTYPVLRRSRDGSVVVGIPYSNILRSQDYLNPAIEAAYRADPKLRGMKFEGTWLPDGRVMIVDQHHRTRAYHAKLGNPVPFVLRPDRNGVFRTNSYLHAMKFHASWALISEEEKFALLEAIERMSSSAELEPAEQARRIRSRLAELYHRSLKLRPLETENPDR